jgi:hypothetical protein
MNHIMAVRWSWILGTIPGSPTAQAVHVPNPLKIRVWQGHCTVISMDSEHIDSRKLYDVVLEKTLLHKAEIDHLSTCEECMEIVRLLVRQQVSAKWANVRLSGGS